MTRDDPEAIVVECPCCHAELVIDVGTRSVVHHSPAPAPASHLITDLAEEAKRLPFAAAEREQTFQRALEAERTRAKRMESKFDELLRRARESPVDKPLKDIDL